MKKRIATIALATGLTGVAAGFALGVPAVSGAATPGSSAAAQGDTAAPKGNPPWVTDALKKLVDNGTLTEAQADKVGAALKDARPEGPGRGRGHHGPSLAVVAKAIGVSSDDLRAALKGGSSIAEVAKSKNVEVAKVIDALVTEQAEKVAAKVKDGTLTQAEADERTADAKARITDFVNGVRPPGGPMGGRMGGGPPDGGSDPAADGAATTTATS